MKKIIATIIATMVALVGLTAPAMAAADPFCENLKDTPAYEKMGCGEGAKEDEFKKVITNILNTIIGISGLVAVVFVVIGGINYMTSTGEAAKIEKAKKTILYALIGLAVCALAFAIVNWAVGAINNKGGEAEEKEDATGSLQIIEIAKNDLDKIVK